MNFFVARFSSSNRIAMSAYRLLRKRRILSLVLVSHLISFTTGSVIPDLALSLIAQRTGFSCPEKNLTACPSNIPFCCPDASKCIMPPTRHGTSVICCPEGRDCSLIEPISCDVNLQNFNEFPYQLLHTTRLHSKLPRCGTQCCPFGYSCQDGHCTMKDQKPSPVSPSNKPTGVPTPTPTKSPQPIIIPEHMNTYQTSSPGFPAKAVVLGLFMGLIAGVALMCLAWYLVRRRQSGKQPPTDGRVELPAGSIFNGQAPSCVSDPVVATQFGVGHRTDFLLRTPESKTSAKTGGLVPSPLRHDLPSNVTPPRRPARSDEDLATENREEGPVRELGRQNTDESYITTGSSSPGGRSSRGASTGSTETINVKLMPPPIMMEGGPNGRGVSTNTTFSALMESSGMKRGQGYLGYPGRWSLSKP